MIASAAFALGHRCDPVAIPHLLEHLHHPDAWVRQGITLGLSGFDEQAAVSGLIVLSEDLDYDVRNWAVFGLASQCDLDTSELRQALLRSANDQEPEIRGEALIGLARRKDERVKELVYKELSGEFHGDWAVEAAERYPDPAFIPLLEALLQQIGDKDRAHFGKHINAALAACQNNTA